MIQAYTVAGFAEAYGMSRSHLYRLWKRGDGPVYYMVGSKRYIAFDAARAWQKALEALQVA